MNQSLSSTTQVVVVTYNPETELLSKNLTAIVAQFKHILVVDNNSKNVLGIENLIAKNYPSIELKKLDDNKGIAFAQNIGLKTAFKKELKWLLTMDQDSIIPANLTSEYEKIIIKYDKLGLIAWDQMPNRVNPKEEIENDWFIVSSGCLTDVRALNSCGGFDNELFIDHVDTDVNMKIRNLGLKTLTTRRVKLFHQLGTVTDKKTIKGNPYVTHSPVRIYYNIRNSIVLFKRYFFKQPSWTMKAIKNCIKEGIYLLYYQPNKTKNFGLLLRACFDGTFNRLGKFK